MGTWTLGKDLSTSVQLEDSREVSRCPTSHPAPWHLYKQCLRERTPWTVKILQISWTMRIHCGGFAISSNFPPLAAYHVRQLVTRTPPVSTYAGIAWDSSPSWQMST